MPIRRRSLLGVAAAVAAGLAGCSVTDRRAAPHGTQRVEVFSWWAGPGEREGYDAIIQEFHARYPDVTFVDAAVAGGAGSNARTVLAGRLQAGDPPDSYQVHAGRELTGDVRADRVTDLTWLYQQERWLAKIPPGLLDAITLDGRIYSVPVNIHRANLLWYRPAVLAAAGIGEPPRTWTGLLDQAEALRAAGLVPLSIGPAWTRKHLMETVLLGELGAERYQRLWSGGGGWSAPEVGAALTLFRRVIAVSNLDATAGEWQAATDKLIDGSAGYLVMGDWVDAYLGRTHGMAFGTDYRVVPSPGSEGVFDFLSDSFTLPKGAPHRAAAEHWLAVCGSVAGQDAFNVAKGSVPARTDTDRSLYRGYLATAMADWQNPATTVVGSLAHGVVADSAWNAAIDTALAAFIADGDVATFTRSITDSYRAGD